MPAVFEAGLEAVTALHPREVVRELPPVVDQEAEAGPVLADGGVGGVAVEGHHRRTAGRVEDAALIRAEQALRPADARRERVAAHEPAVVGDGRVIQQVRLDHPVELLMRVMRRDALIEPRAVVRVVLLRLRFAVELRGAAADLAAVADRGTPVPVEAVAHAEVRREAMIGAHHDVARVEVPGLIARGIARDVERRAGPIGPHHQLRDALRPPGCAADRPPESRCRDTDRAPGCR